MAKASNAMMMDQLIKEIISMIKDKVKVNKHTPLEIDM